MGAEAGKRVQAKEHESYHALTILAVLLPVVGFIMGIIFLVKEKKVDKKLGEHLVAVSILAAILWSVVLYLIVPRSSVGLVNIPAVPVVQSETPAIAPPAHIGSAVNITGSENLTVTVQSIIDPATSGNQYILPDSDNRFVAVKLQITNNAQKTYTDDAYSDVVLIGSDGQTATPSFYPISDCTDFSNGEYTLSSGSSVTGCVAFQLPNAITATKVQFKPEAGFDSDLGEWLVP